MKRTLRERIEARVDVRGPDECWLWNGPVGNSGTATIQIVKGRSRSARRVLWELDHGEVEGRALIMTICGKKLCMNPAHHYLKSLALEDLFWANVVKSDGCWTWTGFKDPSGYGHMFHLGKHYRPHRYSYELHYGPIVGHVGGDPEKEICVCHHCDNIVCVRPDHLFLGTDKDNHDDMVRKGRHAHGPALSEAIRRAHEARRNMQRLTDAAMGVSSRPSSAADPEKP